MLRGVARLSRIVLIYRRKFVRPHGWRTVWCFLVSALLSAAFAAETFSTAPQHSDHQVPLEVLHVPAAGIIDLAPIGGQVVSAALSPECLSLYLLDRSASRLLSIPLHHGGPSGEVETIAHLQCENPTCVAVGSSGRVYVADPGRQLVLVIDPASGRVGTVPAPGLAGPARRIDVLGDTLFVPAHPATDATLVRYYVGSDLHPVRIDSLLLEPSEIPGLMLSVRATLTRACVTRLAYGGRNVLAVALQAVPRVYIVDENENELWGFTLRTPEIRRVRSHFHRLRSLDTPGWARRCSMQFEWDEIIEDMIAASTPTTTSLAVYVMGMVTSHKHLFLLMDGVLSELTPRGKLVRRFVPVSPDGDTLTLHGIAQGCGGLCAGVARHENCAVVFSLPDPR